MASRKLDRGWPTAIAVVVAFIVTAFVARWAAGVAGYTGGELTFALWAVGIGCVIFAVFEVLNHQ